MFGVLARRFETWENSSVFSSVPASKVDAMGKERYIGNKTFLTAVAMHAKESEWCKFKFQSQSKEESEFKHKYVVVQLHMWSIRQIRSQMNPAPSPPL